MFIKLKKDCYDVKSIVRSQEALAWNNDLESRYRSETACGICKQPYHRRKSDHMNFSRVRHHCHLTGEPFEISHAKKSGKAFFAQLKSIFRIFLRKIYLQRAPIVQSPSSSKFESSPDFSQRRVRRIEKDV